MARICKALKSDMKLFNKRINHELTADGKPVYVIRTSPIKEDEVLYDKYGKATVINRKGRLLALMNGDI